MNFLCQTTAGVMFTEISYLLISLYDIPSQQKIVFYLSAIAGKHRDGVEHFRQC